MTTDTLSFYTRQAERELERERVELIARMKNLAHDLEREVERMREDATYAPSSCGVVQGRALTIDAGCHLLKEKSEQIKVLREIAQD